MGVSIDTVLSSPSMIEMMGIIVDLVAKMSSF